MAHSPAVTLRLQRDETRAKLRALDQKDGGRRLLEWTLKTFPEYYEGQAPMAKPSKSTQAAQLLEALTFVSVAGTKDDADYKQHVRLNNGFAVMSDGQMTAGFPITEDLECCPQLTLLKSAISKCGNSLAIAELENGSLSVKGDKLRAIVPCVAFTAMPDGSLLTPDLECAKIDDRLKQAFNVCGVLASEAGVRVIEASLLLEANTCTGTNGAVLMQYWHGIDLPPALVIPKIFAASVGKVKSPLKGFGWTQGRSITFYFENGAWLKTLLYEDKWPDVQPIIDKPSSPVAVPIDLFEAIETVAEFGEGQATIGEEQVRSHAGEMNIGAQFSMTGVVSNLTLASKHAKLIAPFSKQIDLTTYDDRAFFFGDNMRGVIMGIKPRDTTAEETRF